LSGARVYDWLVARYQRSRYYIPVALVATGAVTELFLLPPMVGIPARYFDISLGQALTVGAVVLAATLAAVTIFLIARRHIIIVSYRWSSSRDPVLLDEARAATYEFPRAMVTFGAPLGIAFVVPAATIAMIEVSGYSTALDVIELAIWALAGAITGILAFRFIGELVLLPARASFGSQTELDVPREGLAGKLLATILTVTFVAATFGGLWGADRATDGAGQILEAVAIGLALTLVLMAILAPLLAGGLLAPLRDLTRGTRAVAAGDLGAEVAVTTADELGDLAISFNRMVQELNQASDELGASRARIVAAADESRRRVERDLHDGAQQSLVLLNLKLGLAQQKAAQGGDDAGEAIADARADLDRALDELRDLAHGIYPQVLTTDGLAAALAEAAAEAPIPVETALGEAGRHPPEVEAAVYFCCLEALQNAGKYAGDGARVRMAVAEAEGTLSFEVADDGRGFDVASRNGSGGLQNLADRIGALGGELAVESAPGEGTRIAGSVPVEG